MGTKRRCRDVRCTPVGGSGQVQPTASSPMNRMYDRRPAEPNKTTSYSAGLPPSIPGEPIGMPATASPVAWGFSPRKRWSATAGTCPSMTYPKTSAVWQAARSSGTPSRAFTASRSLLSRTEDDVSERLASGAKG
jgi:hypothetical protein